MSDALDAISIAVAAALRTMPVGHIQAFVNAVQGLSACPIVESGSITQAVANPSYKDAAIRLLDVWREVPDINGRSFGFILCAAAAMRSAEQASESVEPVVTGPSSGYVPVRHTRAVMLELITKAKRELILVSYAAYRVVELVAALNAALDRGVVVRFILETAEASAGMLKFDGAQAFASLENAEFYVWPGENRVPGALLHAKVVVADGMRAFVTSANLTGNAMDSNLEVGIVISGGEVPVRLAEHFRSLVARGVLTRV